MNERRFQSSIRGFSFCGDLWGKMLWAGSKEYFNPLYEALVFAAMIGPISGG